MNYLQFEKKYSYSTVKKAYDTLNECLRQADVDYFIFPEKEPFIRALSLTRLIRSNLQH